MNENAPAYFLDSIRYSDARNLAEIHKKAFPNFFLSELGVGFLTEFYRGYSTDPTAVTCVARDENGNPVGAVVGTTQPAGFYSRLLRRRLWGFGTAALRAALTGPQRAPRLIRAISYRGEVPTSGRDWALLASICVNPDAESSGLGTELVHEWVRRAREAGASVAYLSTDRDQNQRVNKFYRRLGWVVDETYRTREGRPMNRYVRDI